MFEVKEEKNDKYKQTAKLLFFVTVLNANRRKVQGEY
jgi:hypothetical protein